MNTSGFYKNENGSLLYGPNYVCMPIGIELTIDQKDNFDYPVEGWYYFDSEEEAKNFFGING